jgi:hypothetical protein
MVAVAGELTKIENAWRMGWKRGALEFEHISELSVQIENFQ